MTCSLPLTGVVPSNRMPLVIRKMPSVCGLLYGLVRILSGLILLPGQTYTTGMAEEYCERESFEAHCSAPDEVIWIRYAVYGRMKLGRCVTMGYGAVGCSADVTQQVATLCAGRHHCKFPITNLHSSKACPSELMAYLEASYECMRVAGCTENHCDSAQLTEPEGYVASIVTETSSCGTSSCPWVLVPGHGQRFNLTFYSFSDQSADIRHDDVTGSKNCIRFATVVDTSTQITKDITVCDRGERTVFQQTTTSSKIEIRMSTASPSSAVYVVMQYQLIGCADIDAPANGWVKRHGDTVRVGCNNIQRSSHLTCNGLKWVGDIGNCDPTSAVSDTWNVHSALERASTTTEGILAVIGLGIVIGIVLGCSMLLLVVTVYKRRRRREEHEDELRQRELYYSTDVTNKLLQTGTNTTKSCDQTVLYGRQFSDTTGYNTTSSQSQQPVSSPVVGVTSSPMSCRCDHMYESPQFIGT